jgi:tRNA nucleotidyltransferase (CCA-adding enzyme)
MSENGILNYLPGNALISNLEIFKTYQDHKTHSLIAAFTNFIQQAQITDLNKYLSEWKVSNQIKTLVKKSIEFSNAENIDNQFLYDLGLESLENSIDAFKPDNADELIKRYQELPIHNMHDLDINGDDLMKAGINHGPELGHALQLILRKVVSGEIPNEKEKLINEAIKK